MFVRRFVGGFYFSGFGVVDFEDGGRFLFWFFFRFKRILWICRIFLVLFGRDLGFFLLYFVSKRVFEVSKVGVVDFFS